jgi:hypothetical protein
VFRFCNGSNWNKGAESNETNTNYFRPLSRVLTAYASVAHGYDGLILGAICHSLHENGAIILHVTIITTGANILVNFNMTTEVAILNITRIFQYCNFCRHIETNTDISIRRQKLQY